MLFEKIKKILLRLLLASLVLCTVSIVAYLLLRDRYALPIMMYHKVEKTDTVKTDVVTPQNFRRHMEYLKENGYKVITLDEFVRMTEGCSSFNVGLPRKTVVITFDDGYENNYLNAFPVLKEFGYEATIFISPDLVGKEKDKDKFMSWKQIKKMRDEGIIDYGSHGVTQSYLPPLSIKELKFEIGRSKKVIEEKLGRDVACLSYPVGGFNEEIKNIARNEGYRCAVTTNRGNDRYNRDIYELNRIRFSDKDNTNIIMWAKLNGYYNLFRKLKNPH